MVMGYDMYWQRSEPEIEAAVAAATASWDQTIAERNGYPQESMAYSDDAGRVISDDPEIDAVCKRASDAYEAMMSARRNYFRLNIHGMSRYVDAMLELGMAFAWRQPEIEWPDYESIEAEVGADAAEEEYDRRAAPLLKEHGPEIPGIPSWKFGSNDGWWVVPGECTAALRAWQEYAGEVSEETAKIIESDYWGEWLEFLRGAVDHDGFRVR